MAKAPTRQRRSESSLVCFEGAALRSVESQSFISTRKIVDSDAEQRVLERLIDRSKPSVPADDALAGLHYLLATPFRYPPLPHGSRFGTRQERGIWYGALTRRVVWAEVAYYRLVFLSGTRAALGRITTRRTLFGANLSSERTADLRQLPRQERARVCSPVSYAHAQSVGAKLREKEVALCLYPSARDQAQGTCVAVFSPLTFARRVPLHASTEWMCVCQHDAVEISRASHHPDRELHRFERREFEINGELPTPAL